MPSLKPCPAFLLVNCDYPDFMQEGGERDRMLKEEALRDLGSDIRRMRKEMGMSQEMLAEMLDTDFRVLSRYENGQAEMGAVMYRKLERLYERETNGDDFLQQKIKNLSFQKRHVLEKFVTDWVGN